MQLKKIKFNKLDIKNTKTTFIFKNTSNKSYCPYLTSLFDK